MPVSQAVVRGLTQQASFAADEVAIMNRSSSMTGSQQTRAIIHRTLEFLIGNHLIEVVDQDEVADAEGGLWLKIDPPYDPEYLEAE